MFDFPVNFTHAHCMADKQKWWQQMRNLDILILVMNVSKEDKVRYLAKLTLSTGQQLLNDLILHSNWSDNVSLLPPEYI